MRFILLLIILVAAAATAADLPQLPDMSLTPGAILETDASTICVPGYAKSVRHVLGTDKHRVYAEYGIDWTSDTITLDEVEPITI